MMKPAPNQHPVLTSESTLATLIVRKEVARWKPAPLYEEGKKPREVYYSGAWSWFYSRIPNVQPASMETPRSATPAAQIRKFLDAYATGQSPKTVDEFGIYPSWKPMKDSIWEVRAGVTRSFGWFVKGNVLVLVDGALKKELVDENGREVSERYQSFRRSVLEWQKARSLAKSEISDEKDHRKLVT